MDDCPEIALRKLCCTCLSVDRKLYQLCRIYDGVNNLYWLLTYDSEAYREGFYKDMANLFICWECKALMFRVTNFRQQACLVQKQLSHIADGRIDKKSLRTCHSRLSAYHKANFDETYTYEETSDEIGDNFIDCGPDTDIKTEDELDDIPLSKLNSNYISDIDNDLKKEIVSLSVSKHHRQKRKQRSKVKLKKNSLSDDVNKKYYTTIQMNEIEMYESREKRKLAAAYADAEFKCESCLEGFRTRNDLDLHNVSFHTERQNHRQCDICCCYFPSTSLLDHRSNHYHYYSCHFCEYISYDVTDILTHLKGGHAMRNLTLPKRRKKGQRKTPLVKNPGSKPRHNEAMRDKRTPFGYLCPECNKYFDTRIQRYKHIQRAHREGFKCPTCGKRFAFKTNFNRHLQIHEGPPPREECPVCHKMIRVDLTKIHAQTHSDRQTFTCVECDKKFVSRASYEHHLKYTQAHAAVDILKYKCSMCDKGYRSRGELRDHVNYQHMGKTQHKCPVCGKALATPRCITRHVRRAHHNIKESARDKICQQCGKAFRDKKGLREHEFIHTGERPLSCEICGCTFRQSASLYTHKKRVHKIYPQRKHVELLDTVDNAAKIT